MICILCIVIEISRPQASRKKHTHTHRHTHRSYRSGTTYIHGAYTQPQLTFRSWVIAKRVVFDLLIDLFLSLDHFTVLLENNPLPHIHYLSQNIIMKSDLVTGSGLPFWIFCNYWPYLQYLTLGNLCGLLKNPRCTSDGPWAISVPPYDSCTITGSEEMRPHSLP